VIYLIRHAEPLSAADPQMATLECDDGLSEVGLAQAERLGLHLVKCAKGTPRLASSSMLRARQTADVIATHFRTGVSYDDRLRERNFDNHRHLDPGNRQALQLCSYRSPHASFLGEESLSKHRKRVADWYREFKVQVTADLQQDHVIVAHGGTINHLLGEMFAAPIESLASAVIACPCACYHVVSAFSPAADWLVWRVESVANAAA
jgi:broad specificity phosphatase PhoE